MSKTITVSKEATKPVKPAAKPEAKPADKGAMAGMAAALTQAPALTAAQEAKAKRDAERAKRYPQAAAQEAAKKVAETGEKKPKEKVEKKPAVAFVPRLAKKDQTLHLLDERSRPGQGSRLFAHTHAVLTILGLLDPARPAVPQAQLLAMMGQRAVAYHRQKLNLEDAPNLGIRLSVAGRNVFAGRAMEGKIDNAAANAFVTMFLEGKVDHSATGIAQENVYQVKF